MLLIPKKSNKALMNNNAILARTIPDIDSTLSNNSWNTIAIALKSKIAPSSWLGQTKAIGSGEYSAYEFRLIDMQSNRYEKTNGGYTQAVFELTLELPSNIVMNTDSTNIGGWSYSYLREELNSTILDKLPSDLKNIISECKVKSGAGGNSTSVLESNNKLFIPSEYEIMGVTTYSLGASEGTPQFEYYVNHNTSNDMIKKKKVEVGGTILEVAYPYWLRSPSAPVFFVPNNLFVYMNSSGSSYAQYSNNTSTSVAPIFAV